MPNPNPPPLPLLAPPDACSRPDEEDVVTEPVGLVRAPLSSRKVPAPPRCRLDASTPRWRLAAWNRTLITAGLGVEPTPELVPLPVEGVA
jgi:hypothetical protein